MCGLRLKGSVALTALALTFTSAALGASNTLEQGDEAGRIEALVPVPQPAEVRPPTPVDLLAPRPGEPQQGSPEATRARPEAITPAATDPVKQTEDAHLPLAPATPDAPDLTHRQTPPADAEPLTGATAPAHLAPGKETAPAAPSAHSPLLSSTPESTPAGPKTPEKDSKDAAKPLASTLAAADVPVAEKLRELMAGKLERLLDRKKEKPAVEAFYTSRGFAPLWIENGAANARAKAAIAQLKAADLDGLDPNDFTTPDFTAAADHDDLLAEAELKLTNAVLTYARYAQLGRVHFSRISADIFFNQIAPDPADVLAKMASAAEVGPALADYNPPQEGYRALRAKLTELRSRSPATKPTRIAPGPVLKVGMHDERVRLVRERLGLGSGAADDSFTKPLAEAVKDFQRQHDLPPTGTLNAATLAALNGPRREHDADIIIANMERWRWLPRDLGKTHVLVNIPDYSLKVVHNGAIVWHTRIVVGKPSTPTPLLSETMKYITINPTWNVPPSIVNNEYLPVLQQDPYALSRIGLRVDYNRDGSIHIFQPPGDGNALGRIRFNFPNKFLVYQHDTPDKHLFARDKRAYSHGCMRVQDPLKYGEVLLSLAAPNQGYTTERLRRMFGSEERDIHLPSPIPVHISYQTAFVDEAGKLVIRDDVYGRDGRILATLKGEERRFADTPIERGEQRNHRRQAIRLAPRYPAFPPTYNGFPFFDRMFR
jgi:L,D-transpeptidase YcbB